MDSISTHECRRRLPFLADGLRLLHQCGTRVGGQGDGLLELAESGLRAEQQSRVRVRNASRSSA